MKVTGIDDPEPKFGMAVTGVVHPEEVITNAGAEAEDVIVLTKPLGSGITSTAMKRDEASDELVKTMVEIMATLNDRAAQAMRRIGVRGATDVTGFGLLGHLGEMIRASGLSATLEWDAVPFVDGVAELAESGVIPGGTKRNLAATQAYTDFGRLDNVGQWLLADAQTSGGLLVAVNAPLEKAFHQALADEDVEGWTIGRFRERTFEDDPSGRITVEGSR